MTHQIAAPAEGGASAAHARSNSEPPASAITTAHDVPELHHAPQKPDVEPGAGDGIRHRGGPGSITRVEAKVSLEEVKDQLSAYRSAHGVQQRRQCVETLRKSMASLDPADRNDIQKEMEFVSAEHLWHALEMPAEQWRINSAMEKRLGSWATLVHDVAPTAAKSLIGTAYGLGITWPVIERIISVGPNPGWKEILLKFAGQVAAIGVAEYAGQALVAKAGIAMARQVFLEPARDAAGEDRRPEITEMLSAVLDRVSVNKSADRMQCAAALGAFLLAVPQLRDALARFAVTGDPSVLDAPFDEAQRLLETQAEEWLPGALNDMLPLDPEFRYAERCLEDRRLNTEDAIETVSQAWASRKQVETGKAEETKVPELDLSDKAFHADVQAALGRPPLGLKEDLYYSIREDLKKELGQGKSAPQIFKSCLLEVRSAEAGASLVDPAMEDRLDKLIAKHRELRASTVP